MFTLSFQFRTLEVTNVKINLVYCCSNIGDEGTVPREVNPLQLQKKLYPLQKIFADNDTDRFHGTLKADEPG